MQLQGTLDAAMVATVLDLHQPVSVSPTALGSKSAVMTSTVYAVRDCLATTIEFNSLT